MEIIITFTRRARIEDILAVQGVIFKMSGLQSRRLDKPGQPPRVVLSGKKKVLGEIRGGLVGRISLMRGVREVS